MPHTQSVAGSTSSTRTDPSSPIVATCAHCDSVSVPEAKSMTSWPMR